MRIEAAIERDASREIGHVLHKRDGSGSNGLNRLIVGCVQPVLLDESAE